MSRRACYSLGFAVSHCTFLSAAIGGAASRSCSSVAAHTTVAIVGKGLVGSEFLNQLSEQQDSLLNSGVPLQLRAVVGSSSMLLGELNPGSWAADFESRAVPTDLEQVNADIIIDCTASDAVAGLYPGWLANGSSVVTANKRLGSGDLGRYRSARDHARSTGSTMMYEATVGAGLPVISTLQSMQSTGDTVHKIQGVLSVSCISLLLCAVDIQLS